MVALAFGDPVGKSEELTGIAAHLMMTALPQQMCPLRPHPIPVPVVARWKLRTVVDSQKRCLAPVHLHLVVGRLRRPCHWPPEWLAVVEPAVDVAAEIAA